jgi:hypothetical protein
LRVKREPIAYAAATPNIPVMIATINVASMGI